MSLNLTSSQKQSMIWLTVALAFVLLLLLLGPILMPFIVAGTLAYVLNPWVDRLHRIRIKKIRMPRSAAASIVILVLILAILAVLLIMLPILQKQIPQLQSQIPLFLNKIDELITPLLHNFGFNVHIDSASIKEFMTEHLANSGDEVGKALFASLKVGGTAVLALVANLLLIPIVLFYLLVDWHELMGRIKRFIPLRWSKQTVSRVQEVDELLGQYLHGQLLVMLALSVYYSVGLSIAGFDLALPVGILTGILVFIPYLGFGIGLFLALVSAVLQFNDMTGLIAVAIIYGLGQAIESFYLTPKLVGERIGLHPLVVIFALMAFGQLFGFIGILVALPASAVLSVVVKYLRISYLNSSFYQQK